MELNKQPSVFISDKHILTKPIERYANANNASCFRLIPQVVIQLISVDMIRSLLHFTQQNLIPLTFRAVGTRLSGQSITDGMLTVVSQHWGQVRVEESGRRVLSQPGMLGGQLKAEYSTEP